MFGVTNDTIEAFYANDDAFCRNDGVPNSNDDTFYAIDDTFYAINRPFYAIYGVRNAIIAAFYAVFFDKSFNDEAKCSIIETFCSKL